MNQENAKRLFKSKWEVKALNTFTGRDGYGYTANLYYEGKKVGEVADYGDGGPVDVNIKDQKIMEKYKELAATFSEPWKFDPGDMQFDIETITGALVEMKEDQKLCKKGMVVRLKSRPGQVMSYNLQATPHLMGKIKEKHGDDLIEILNERFI